MMRTPFCFAYLEGANARLPVDNINRVVSTFPFNDRNFKDTYGNCLLEKEFSSLEFIYFSLNGII